MPFPWLAKFGAAGVVDAAAIPDADDPWLGAVEATSVEWLGPSTLRISWATAVTDRHVQVYANRMLIGVTSSTAQTSLAVGLAPSRRATPLSFVLVKPTDVNIDVGHLLPWHPWNRYKVRWTAPVDTTDLYAFDIVMSTAPGGAYDSSNLIATVPFKAATTVYEYCLPYIADPGDWQVAIIPRDNANPDGNAGTALDTTIAAVVYPLDFTLDANKDRFTASVSGGVLTTAFTYGT